MPCFSGLITESKMIIPVGILEAGTFNDENVSLYRALVDTGATSTFISKQLILDSVLKPVGKGPMRSATDTKETNIYNIKLLLFLDKKTPYIKDNLQVREFNNESPDYDLIIGMDLIIQGSLTVSCGKNFTFCL